MPYKTEQEAFWAVEFGIEHISRNRGAEPQAANLAFFSKALANIRQLSSGIEFGAMPFVFSRHITRKSQ